MGNYRKNWENGNIVNFSIELNRIENYNKYVDYWLSNYYNCLEIINTKTDWSITDIVDINDFNRILGDIDLISYTLGIEFEPFPIKYGFNQIITVDDMNNIENKILSNMLQLGENQFSYNITGLTFCGDDSMLNIGE